MTELRGIAWNHSRGFVSVVATAQRFEELNPGVRILWEKRSLQAFADASLADLADRYDLIVMDHPHTAEAADAGVLVALDECLSEEFLADQASNSVGASHESYQWNGRQWTLATDAATPIATWRPDLLQKHGLRLPETWDDVLALARQGHVAVSLFPVDVLMNVYMFCDALGKPAFQDPEQFADRDTLRSALECLRELAALCPTECLDRNPIATAEFMTQTDEAVYCPFAYGYSNYSRPGYAPQLLKAGGLVRFNERRLRSTLGGAGLAVSARTQHQQACMEYTAFTASPDVQRGLYFQAGGQPGHRGAWEDEAVNEASNGFFKDTLSTLDEAIVRPRYPGYMRFQDNASPVVHRFVSGKASFGDVADELDRIHRQSRKFQTP
jgi:multiple sugar transport system substrate-binding protein